MLFPQHGRFVKCDVDYSCFEQALTESIWTIIKHFINGKLDITGSAEVQSAIRALVSALEQLDAKSRHGDWYVRRGVAPVQLFPRYINYFFGICSKDAEILTELLPVPMNKWGALW